MAQAQVSKYKEQKGATYSHSKLLGRAHAREFTLKASFRAGYRNREDVTTLPSDIMVVGSQNVLTNTFKRIGARKGYTLDGQRSISRVSATGYFQVTDYTQITGVDAGKTITIAGISLTFGTDIPTGGLVSNADLASRIVTAINASAINVPLSVTGVHAEVGALPDHTTSQAVLIANVQGSSSNTITTTTTANATMFALGPMLGGGSDDSQTNPILSSYDWVRHTGDERHLRAGYDANGGTGKLQYRYVAAAGDKYDGTTLTAGQVYWIDLMTGLTSSRFSFTEFWWFTSLQGFLLFVNGTNNIFIWSGGVTNVSSATANTITKTGTKTWAQEGFLYDGTFSQQVRINDTIYTYTGGADTTTLTGVTPSPIAEPVNSVAHQEPNVQTNATIPSIPPNFQQTIIKSLNNQVYLAGKFDQSVYVSKVNDFRTYTFSSPRLVGEGAILTLDAVPKSLIPEKEAMFFSAGKDFWYRTAFTLSSDLKAETLDVERIKTTAKQGAQSENLTTKVKNNIAYVSYEPIVNMFGTAQNFLDDPQVTDLSFPIVEDVNTYDFTDGTVKFHKKYLYVTVPSLGIMRVYNMTDDGSSDNSSTPTANHYWETPLTMPMGCLSVIDGDLYGHSAQTSNTFKLFDGGTDDGHPMLASAVFAFDSGGTRNLFKSSNSCYVEGYITANTKLDIGLLRDIHGSIATFIIDGADTSIVTPLSDDSSFGKVSIGKVSIGSSSVAADQFSGTNTNLPKFRVYKTYPRVPYFEEQVSFTSQGKDQTWELIAFGTDSSTTSELPTSITQ